MDEGIEVLVVNEPQSANRFFNELIFDAVLGSHLAVQNREFDFVLSEPSAVAQLQFASGVWRALHPRSQDRGPFMGQRLRPGDGH